MKNSDAIGHVTGRSVFVDDMPVIGGTLHAAVIVSPIANGRIKAIDLTQALAFPGVIRILTAGDIPGENQIGGILSDEPLFAVKEVGFIGQPIAMVVAKTQRIARMARNRVKIEYEEYQPITDPRVAKENAMYLLPPRTFKTGDVDATWSKCDYVFKGTANTGAQEHVYLETQGSYACPGENGNLMIYSSTQGPTIVQKTISRVLGVPMNRIEVDVQRLGGAFGGKEDQANPWAAMAALAAFHLKKPVKLVLSRHDDLYMTGKRHPYSSDFRIGLTKDLKILAWEVVYFQNGGASADLSPPIMERTLFHATNSYFIPNVTVTAFSCRTNLPPNTAFRGFGAPQSMFVMESAIALAASELGVPAHIIQEKNLINTNDHFPYGQAATNADAVSCWKEAFRKYHFEEKENEISRFNESGTWFRKGLAMMPVCFGISFTKTHMNQARAMVNIYQDGSIGISTGAVEMGQGVNTKMKQVAAHFFSIDPGRIKLGSTNTSRVANTSPTAASSGADLNGKALQKACNVLWSRIKETAAVMTKSDADQIAIRNERVLANGKDTGYKWEDLIKTAFLERVNLTEVGHYATPDIFFDRSAEKGNPFAYHVYGAALLVVSLDCLRGCYRVESVQIVHDFGNSMNSDLDLGQIEGGVLQGIGWMTMEEVKYNEKGRLLSDSLSAYKIPGIYSAPKIFECEALNTEGPELAIMRSKAIGEPPFMYGIGAFFALQNAIKSFNPQAKMIFDAPLTPEKVLLALYPQ
jgi:xanthine dehydrogenase large subunit